MIEPLSSVEPLANPPQPHRPFLFTKENARAFQAKAAATRRHNVELAKAKLKEAQTAALILPAFALAVQTQGRIGATLHPRAAEICKQIERLELAMSNPKLSASDLIKLSERQESLIRLERELVGSRGQVARGCDPVEPIDGLEAIPLRGPTQWNAEPIM